MAEVAAGSLSAFLLSRIGPFNDPARPRGGRTLRPCASLRSESQTGSASSQPWLQREAGLAFWPGGRLEVPEQGHAETDRVGFQFKRYRDEQVIERNHSSCLGVVGEAQFAADRETPELLL